MKFVLSYTVNIAASMFKDLATWPPAASPGAGDVAEATGGEPVSRRLTTSVLTARPKRSSTSPSAFSSTAPTGRHPERSAPGRVEKRDLLCPK